MRYVRQVVLSLLVLTVAASVASAQRPAQRRPQPSQGSLWELGSDAGLNFGLDNPSVTTLNVLSQSFRAGYYFTPEWSLEPFFGLNYIKVEGVDGVTLYNFGAGALYHFQQNRAARQFYLRPFLTVVGASGPGNDNSDVGIGLGGGVKWPRLGGRLALRGEAYFSTVNTSTLSDNTSIGALFGLSIYTR
ncbi:MAG TPA: hypothetical protein VFT29_13380 [Gemmatimonadaceae bacterium]|nr:hypothetical protein [Gemmatimonadaceae bacterium]